MPHDCQYEKEIKTMMEQVGDIHKAVLGDIKNPEKEGLIPRVKHLENWRTTMTNSIKTHRSVVYSILTAVIAAFICKQLGLL